MSEREPKVSRLRHLRASLSRQSRGRGKDSIAIIVLTLLAIVMTLWIFTQQKASLPSWAPLVGEDFAHLSADFSDAQAVTPGQGQAVVIAGIQVGKISSVDLEDGHAVIGMDIEPKYMKLIHPNASLLLRPKTNLNDMTVEIEPGSGSEHVESGYRFPLSRTEPSIQFEALLSTLDTDTQQYLQLLVAGGAQGIGGRGRQLSGAFRRLQPFSHYIADLNRAVAQRRVALSHVIHDFGLLTTELGRHDSELERFVSASKGALGNFANQQQALQESLVEFPSTLTALRSALASSDRFSTAARPALIGLIPQAQASVPAFKANEQLFKQTTAPIRDQIRPFTRQIRPVLDPPQRRFLGSQHLGQQLRHLAGGDQQPPQRARLQAEGQQGELPLLPALVEPQHKCNLQPRRRRGPDNPWRRDALLQRLLPRLQFHPAVYASRWQRSVAEAVPADSSRRCAYSQS